MSELCRSRRSEGYGVCDDVEGEVYTAPPSRRSDAPRFSVSSVFPCRGSWSFSRAG